MEVSRGELLCLALDATPAGIDRTPVPARHSLSGLRDVVTSEDEAEPLDVPGTLAELETDGLVERAVRPVEGQDEHQQVFGLTEAGRKHALELRRELVDEPVTVSHDGTLIELSLGDVGEYLESDVPMVQALVELDRTGVVDADRRRPGERFVGRDRIRSLFEEELRQSEDDPMGLILRGPSGVGKSTLTDECARTVRSSGGSVLVGTTPRSGSAPYAPFRSVFTTLVDGPTPFETITPPDEHMDAEEYQSMRLSLFYDLYKLLQDHARETPTLVVLRDLQWARRGTLDLLTFLITRLDEVPVTFLCTVNTEYQNEDDQLIDHLGEDHRPVTDDHLFPVDVEPLDRREIEPLVRWHLRADDVPAGFLDLIHEHTGGNPSYVGSLLDLLVETDVVDPGTHTYPDTADELTLPEDTRSVIESRLERLDDDQRELVEAVAIVGERVSLSVLARMTDREEAELRSVAREIVTTALWEPSEQVTVPLSRTYRFRTPLARQVVLDTLDARRRPTLHETAAEAILDVTLMSNRLNEAIAAEHFDQAARPERALSTYHDAGDRATSTYAHEEATEYYERALDLASALDRQDTRLEILESLSRVQYCMGDADAASEYLERLLSEAEDPERVQSAELARWRMAKDRGDFGQADEYARAGIEALDEPTRFTCRFWGKLGWTQLQRGNVEEAAEHFEKQEELANRLDDDVCYGNLYYNRAELAQSRGDLDEAKEVAKRSIIYHERSESHRDAAKSHMLLGNIYVNTDGASKSVEYFEKSLDHLEETGDRVLELYLDANRATRPYYRGEWDEALRRYREIIETARTLDQRRVLTVTLCNICIIHCYRGNLSNAKERANEAMQIGQKTDAAVNIGRAYNKLARIHILRRNLDTAIDLATKAQEHLAASVPTSAAEAECRLGDANIEKDDPKTALDWYRKSRDRAVECDSTEWFCRASAGCATALLRTDRVDRAGEQAKNAVEEAESLGDPAVFARARLSFARYLRVNGDLNKANSELTTALETARDINATVLACRILIEIGRLSRMKCNTLAQDWFRTAFEVAERSNVPLLEYRCHQITKEDQ
jgi:tetratricopeptide (TPR) repeat protein